jgi:hypothetical protein
MKKTLTKKLSINKETVANLSNLAMKTVKAGVYLTGTCPARCTTTIWQFCTYGCKTDTTICGTVGECTLPCYTEEC